MQDSCSHADVISVAPVLRWSCHPDPSTSHQQPEAVVRSAPALALNGVVTPQRGTALRLDFAQATAKRQAGILRIPISYIYYI